MSFRYLEKYLEKLLSVNNLGHKPQDGRSDIVCKIARMKLEASLVAQW